MNTAVRPEVAELLEDINEAARGMMTDNPLPGLLTRCRSMIETLDKELDRQNRINRGIQEMHDDEYRARVESNRLLAEAKRQLAEYRADAERLRAALRQASFCIRELIPDDKDATLTIAMIDRTLIGTAARGASTKEEK